MSGLSWVDYSDIKVEFDDLADIGARMDVKSGLSRLNHYTPGSFGTINVYEKSNGLIAQARRAEREIYGYRLGERLAPAVAHNYGRGLVKEGFVDALHSVVRDVDLYDPKEEMNVFMKYMLIRADFVGGQCHKCRGTNNIIINVSGQIGYKYLYQCKSCRAHFTPKTGALFHKTRISLTSLMDVLRLSLDPVGKSMDEISARVGVTRETAWHLRRLIRDNSLATDRWRYEHGVDELSRAKRRAMPMQINPMREVVCGRVSDRSQVAHSTEGARTTGVERDGEAGTPK